MSRLVPAAASASTEALTRRGLRLTQLTVAYNVIEGIVAVTIGLMAGLVSLVGFGLDSGIESAAAVLVGLRLASRLRHGDIDEAKERRTLKAVAITFYVLAAYVIIEGVRSLLGDEAPETSWIGIGLLFASVIIMPVLAREKTKVAQQLGGDRLILASSDGRLVYLSPANGHLLTMVDVNAPVYLSPVVANNTLYVLDDKGRLTAWR